MATKTAKRSTSPRGVSEDIHQVDLKSVHDGSFTFALSPQGQTNFNGGKVFRVDPKKELPSKGDVRAVIPLHCFERSIAHGFVTIARDMAVVAVFALVAYLLLDPVMPSVTADPVAFVTWAVGWNIYAFWQGTALTGLWVIAHECGHGAFSSSKTLNDIVGYVLHTALLVPYFAWQFSHKKHHIRTNHLLDGETHVPSSAKGFGVRPEGKLTGMAALADAVGDEAFAGLQVVGHLLVGWPLYLLKNDTGGRRNADGTRKSGKDVLDHFRPSSKLFPERMQMKAALGTAGIFVVLAVLGWASTVYGVWAVANFYIFPYLWVNAWLVLYTWLQHTHLDVPHYDDAEWSWIRGALGTVDRPYGIFDWFHHKIGSTHVVHHLFSEIPWYHADEATIHVRNRLGPLHNYDARPWYQAMWQTARDCHFVESLEGVQYFKSLADVKKAK
jgi:omega-6 fatty acid desaturase (delta-12 desaturase)